MSKRPRAIGSPAEYLDDHVGHIANLLALAEHELETLLLGPYGSGLTDPQFDDLKRLAKDNAYGALFLRGFKR